MAVLFLFTALLPQQILISLLPSNSDDPVHNIDMWLVKDRRLIKGGVSFGRERPYKKYCQTYGMPRAACCSYEVLVCLAFDSSTMDKWQGTYPKHGLKTPAALRWILREGIAANLVIFLFKCLRQSFISQNVGIQNFTDGPGF